MQIVNCLPIISPVSIAMSEGDVIRLNRMYKCGTTDNGGNNLTVPVESTSISNEIEKHEPKSTLFGMFIFKISREN